MVPKLKQVYVDSSKTFINLSIHSSHLQQGIQSHYKCLLMERERESKREERE